MSIAADQSVPERAVVPETAGAPAPSPPARPGELRSVTVLAEGPFCDDGGVPLTASVQVPVERLEPGPLGARFAIEVRQAGAARPVPVSLTADGNPWQYEDVPGPLSANALLEDPRFLAQHAYGIAASTLSLFETTLGRRMPWAFAGSRLTLSVFDKVAFADSGYVRNRGRIRFGHRRDERVRRHVSQACFHDLVAHEVTHAIVDGYRPHWADPLATLDQFAIHEGVADLVAMLSVFTSSQRVERELATLTAGGSDGHPYSGQNWHQRLLRTGLFRLADGLYSRGSARTYLESQPIPTPWRWEREPHHRGQALVRAVLETLLAIWLEQLGRPGGRSSRYQVAASGATAGRRVLRLLIRGLGYTPPVDATFEDLLRGILAADQVVVPADAHGYRRALRTAFGGLGITAEADDNLDGMRDLHPLRYPVRPSAMTHDPEEVNRFIWENPALQRAARLDPDTPTLVERVRPSVRVSPDGFVVSEIGATFIQTVTLSSREAHRRLGIRTSGYSRVVGGGLLRFDEGGRLCFAALKPVMDPDRQQSKWAQRGEPSTSEGSPQSEATFGGMHGRVAGPA